MERKKKIKPTTSPSAVTETEIPPKRQTRSSEEKEKNINKTNDKAPPSSPEKVSPSKNSKDKSKDIPKESKRKRGPKILSSIL